MDKMEFAEEMKKQLPAYLPDECRDAQIQIKKIPKNNSVRTGIIICRKNETMGRILYLEDILELPTVKDIRSACFEMAQVYIRAYKEQQEFKLPDLRYESIKDDLRIRLYHAESNRGLIADVPHKRILDLAAVPYLSLKEENGSLSITNNLIKEFGWNASQVLADAVSNMEQEQINIKSMAEILKGMGQEIAGFESEGQGMMILTNQEGYLGACHMVNKKAMWSIGETIGNCVILPCSIHEVILLPASEFPGKKEDFNELEKTISYINRNALAPEDVLSDKAYYYNAEERTLSIPTIGRKYDFSRSGEITKPKSMRK